MLWVLILLVFGFGGFGVLGWLCIILLFVFLFYYEGCWACLFWFVCLFVFVACDWWFGWVCCFVLVVSWLFIFVWFCYVLGLDLWVVYCGLWIWLGCCVYYFISFVFF